MCVLWGCVAIFLEKHDWGGWCLGGLKCLNLFLLFFLFGDVLPFFLTMVFITIIHHDLEKLVFLFPSIVAMQIQASKNMSCHQDDITFLDRGDFYKPSFATIAGNGDNLMNVPLLAWILLKKILHDPKNSQRSGGFIKSKIPTQMTTDIDW